MKTFSWSRYDSLRLDPEPGSSIWDFEIEEEPEPDAVDCAECGYYAENGVEIDGVRLCLECVINNLCPDWLEAA